LFAVSGAAELNKLQETHSGLNAQITFSVSRRPELLNRAVSCFSEIKRFGFGVFFQIASVTGEDRYRLH